MSTENYKALRQAMVDGRSVTLLYNGYYREVSPHVIGLKNGQEKVLTFQFGGGSSSALPPGGQWRCMFLSEVSEIRLLDKPWQTGINHRQPQSCVDQVDLEVWVGDDGKPYIHAA